MHNGRSGGGRRGGGRGRGGGDCGRGDGDRGHGGRGNGSGQRRGATSGQSGRGRGVGRGVSRGRESRTNEAASVDPAEERNRIEYSAWKRLIKSPASLTLSGPVWKDAVKILENDDKNSSQMLIRDLVDHDSTRGLQHVQVHMGDGRLSGSHAFLQTSHSFLCTLTHANVLNVLSIDTVVGDLYEFVGGSGGSRAVPYFTSVLACLRQEVRSGGVTKTHREILTFLTIALQELLRRVQRVAFNDELPKLVQEIQSNLDILETDPNSALATVIRGRCEEIQRMIDRAAGRIVEAIPPATDGGQLPVASTYPTQLRLPLDRHDNDKMNITEIQILPTEDEIRSNHAEFLPSTLPDQPHFLNGPARWLDTHFRLLRHDIFGELKNVLGGFMHAIESDPSILSTGRLSVGNFRARVYPSAQLTHLSYDRQGGLVSSIKFLQPPNVRNKKPKERSKWWNESKHLEESTLLCLLSHKLDKASILFFTVSQKITDPNNAHGLADSQLATTYASLASQSQADFEAVIDLHIRRRNASSILVELPGIMLATFMPILKNLQTMQRHGQLPFHQWIVPQINSAEEPGKVMKVPPPVYARSAGFKFDLKSILKNPNTALELDPNTSSVASKELALEVERRTTLDIGQCQALVDALKQCFVFIQGPPGTGKSYLGVHLIRVLLDNKDKAKLGPIVIVCYTNHALDQFLEHLLDVGIEKIIRVGSQSKSARLAGKTLQVVAKHALKTRSEGYSLAMLYQSLDENSKFINSNLRRLQNLQAHRWPAFAEYLRTNCPKIHQQFLRVDEEGFELVGRDPFEDWVPAGIKTTSLDAGTDTDNSAQLRRLLNLASNNVYSLDAAGRLIVLAHWIKEIGADVSSRLDDLLRSSERKRRELERIHEESDRRVLAEADIIGVTTTGLARKISTFRRLPAKVIVCEEAGEVLEAHLLSALFPKVEHCIQIGDPQQLRPQITNFVDLSLESHKGQLYKLDRSQFERLCVNDGIQVPLPFSQINVQRRMRPDISKLVRNTLYPRLVDHESTLTLPDVVGMRKNVFWLDHEYPEDGSTGDSDTRSRSNKWEVKMTRALVRHIVRQGTYKTEEVAVLTPYSGQLQKLRSALRDDFEIVLSDRDQETLLKDGFEVGADENSDDNNEAKVERKRLSEMLRLATVDNFQGEEAKIIIVTLVRSNDEKKVGFLRTTNRINVLLSRAQHGMYLIGNSETYSRVPMWSEVIGMLQADTAVGKSFDLCCPRHPNDDMKIHEPEDFEIYSPEGGCRASCDRRLGCGHQCTSKCHSDQLHRTFFCPQQCERLHQPCGHACPKVCGEACGLCQVQLPDISLPCGHIKSVLACHETQNLSKVMCTAPTVKKAPCGHKVTVPCCKDVNSEFFRCPTPCPKMLSCGHQCTGTCAICSGPEGHKKCGKVCGRPQGTCNHTCRSPCHDGSPCGLCKLKCEVKCPHSVCDKRCYEPCAPCVEKCIWECEHQGGCKLPCSAPCDRLPCTQRCSQLLSCGHQCPTVCGEACPDIQYCQICTQTRKNDRVDMLEFKAYEEINLNENPIVVLSCGHFFTAETLDGLMGMSEVYEQDVTGEYTGLKDASFELAKAIPQCPDCRRPIRQFATRRYNRIVNRAVIDEMSKRFMVNGKEQLQELDASIRDFEEELQNGSQDSVKAEYVRKRAGKGGQLVGDLNKFLKETADRHQPVQKLHDATIKAQRNVEVEERMARLSISNESEDQPIALDRRISFGGRALQLKLQAVLIPEELSNILRARKLGDDGLSGLADFNPGPHVTTFFKKCSEFITESAAMSLPKLNVEARLYYARVAQSYHTYCFSRSTNMEIARERKTYAQQLVEEALELCKQPFQGSTELAAATEGMQRLLGKEWYQPVGKDELEAIKAAMVSGAGGIATHSGHWYNCENGHPFAIGECGMPMEVARCPECGAPVGGRGHQPLAGVTRATNMED